MKKFQFPLERVRSWREEQVEVEKTKLRKLFDELHAYQTAIRKLEQELAEEQRVVVHTGVVDIVDLRALESFRLFVRQEKARLGTHIADCQRRIDEQRRRLIDTQRQFRLLEKMKERQWGEWMQVLNKEVDQLASEVYVSQWKEDRQRRSKPETMAECRT